MGGVGVRRRNGTEVEFVLVVGRDQFAFQLGFEGRDLLHEVVMLSLTLLVLSPVGVAEVRWAFQSIPWGCGRIGAEDVDAVSGADRPAWGPEASAGSPDG